MDHNEALASKATERYMLDELPPEERDAFEEHFFDCSECAFDVRSAVQMVDALGKTANVVDLDSRRKWSWWLPKAAAAAVLFGTMGWIGGMQFTPAPQPQIVEMSQVDLGEAERGPGDVKVIPGGAYVSLNVDIPHHDEAVSYVYAVNDGTGKTLFSGTRSREQAAAESVSLLLPALPRGSYHVVIEGVRENGNRFPIPDSSMNFRVGER